MTAPISSYPAAMKAKPDEFNKPIDDIRNLITRIKNVVISCDGELSFRSGTLSWGGLRIFHTDSNGVARLNTVAAGSTSVASGSIAYVDLDPGTQAVSVATASISAGADSNFISYNRLVLGYRNSVSGAFWPVNWSPVVAGQTPYDMPGFERGMPGAGVTIMRVEMVRRVIIPAGCTGSVATAKTEATAEAVFSIRKNGVEVGTTTFAAAATTGVFAAASDIDLAINDFLEVVAPSSPDATLGDVTFTFTGYR